MFLIQTLVISMLFEHAFSHGVKNVRNVWRLPHLISNKAARNIMTNDFADAELRSVLNSLTSITHVTNRYVVRLHNKKGVFLAISKSGNVYGVPRKTPNTVFVVLVYNPETVRLQNVKTKKYISVSCENRKIVATSDVDQSSVLKYRPGHDMWVRFEFTDCYGDDGNNQPDSRYLGFTGTGVRKKATVTTYYDESAMFQIESVTGKA